MRLRLLFVALIAVWFVASPVAAQDPPPRIGPFVVDVHGTMPRFPADDQQLADSRGLLLSELPGAGLGLHAGAHVYPFRWKAVTFGLGADLTLGRAHHGSSEIADNIFGRATTERFTHIAPQVSFNFGDGDGWSYLSGGIGTSTWSVVPDASVAQAPDTEHLTTINYGGGARWFMKRHLAFSFDVRFYAIDPTTPLPGRPTGPRTTLLSFGAGISIK
ncbi:MAG: outer membrane beta-barrel protein [Vicinamibacterales bacterium]